jgi:hypothetical protein
MTYAENTLLAAVVVSFAMVHTASSMVVAVRPQLYQALIKLISSHHAQHGTGMQLSGHNCIKAK